MHDDVDEIVVVEAKNPRLVVERHGKQGAQRKGRISVVDESLEPVGPESNYVDVAVPVDIRHADDAAAHAYQLRQRECAGLRLRRSNPARDLRPCVAISAIKFVLMPFVGIGLAMLAGLDGTTIQVIAICASMPVAFTAVVAAVLYRLDDELVGSFWLVTSLAMVVIVPVLAFVVPILGQR